MSSFKENKKQIHRSNQGKLLIKWSQLVPLNDNKGSCDKKKNETSSFLSSWCVLTGYGMECVSPEFLITCFIKRSKQKTYLWFPSHRAKNATFNPEMAQTAQTINTEMDQTLK